ncbi:MAG: type II secretion system F family protein [Candidatus Riflebacteria bacterium]|nr:type II secretion system F family protein [Candidatus Riflebacteria bacterium]
MSGALKAGRSLEQGFSLVERGMPSPISDEFRTIRTEQELGIPFEESLKNFMKRTPSKDYKLFLTATLFQRETGGNLIALYDQIVFAVSERRRLKGRLNNLTIQGRYSGYIMMCIPIVFCLYMAFINPDRFFALMSQPHGMQLFLISFLWLTIGVVWLWNIVNRMLG